MRNGILSEGLGEMSQLKVGLYEILLCFILNLKNTNLLEGADASVSKVLNPRREI